MSLIIVIIYSFVSVSVSCKNRIEKCKNTTRLGIRLLDAASYKQHTSQHIHKKLNRKEPQCISHIVKSYGDNYHFACLSWLGVLMSLVVFWRTCRSCQRVKQVKQEVEVWKLSLHHCRLGKCTTLRYFYCTETKLKTPNLTIEKY